MKENEWIDLAHEHFELYKHYVRDYLLAFGLTGWDVNFRFKHSDSSFASVWYNVDGRCCTFCLATKWNTPPIDSMLHRVAFHEVCELFLTDLTRFSYQRNFTEEDIEKEIHRVIRTLENMFLGDRELDDEEKEYAWLDANCEKNEVPE